MHIYFSQKGRGAGRKHRGNKKVVYEESPPHLQLEKGTERLGHLWLDASPGEARDQL